MTCSFNAHDVSFTYPCPYYLYAAISAPPPSYLTYAQRTYRITHTEPLASTTSTTSTTSTASLVGHLDYVFWQWDENNLIFFFEYSIGFSVFKVHTWQTVLNALEKHKRVFLSFLFPTASRRRKKKHVSLFLPFRPPSVSLRHLTDKPDIKNAFPFAPTWEKRACVSVHGRREEIHAGINY